MQLEESILRVAKLIGMVLPSIFTTILGKNTFLRKAIDALLQIEYIPIQKYIGEMPVRNFIRVMKALSDPNRVKILKMLQQKSLCVCEIQAAMELAQPNVSKHLKVLEEAGLVGYRKSGLWVNYHLTEGSDSPYAATLLGNLRHWLQHDPEVVRLVERLSSIRREDVCKKQPLPSFQSNEANHDGERYH